MGQIGGTWYWAPGDNISSLKTGLGEITLEGFYGTPQDRPGHSGVESGRGRDRIIS